MFWNDWLRRTGRTLLVIGILGSVVCGILFWSSDEEYSILYGFLALGLGIFFSLCSVSFIMVISEIFLSLSEINEKLTAIIKNKQSNSTAKKSSVDATWVCTCGKRNKNTLSSCDNCGKPKQ